MEGLVVEVAPRRRALEGSSYNPRSAKPPAFATIVGAEEVYVAESEGLDVRTLVKGVAAELLELGAAADSVYEYVGVMSLAESLDVRTLDVVKSGTSLDARTVDEPASVVVPDGSLDVENTEASVGSSVDDDKIGVKLIVELVGRRIEIVSAEDSSDMKSVEIAGEPLDVGTILDSLANKVAEESLISDIIEELLNMGAVVGAALPKFTKVAGSLDVEIASASLDITVAVAVESIAADPSDEPLEVDIAGEELKIEVTAVSLDVEEMSIELPDVGAVDASPDSVEFELLDDSIVGSFEDTIEELLDELLDDSIVGSFEDAIEELLDKLLDKSVADSSEDRVEGLLSEPSNGPVENSFQDIVEKPLKGLVDSPVADSREDMFKEVLSELLYAAPELSDNSVAEMLDLSGD